MPFNIYSLYRLFQPKLRRGRLQVFLENLRPNSSSRILDVGGYVGNWEGAPITSKITVLNLSFPPASRPISTRFTSKVGDGRKMEFADQSFDILFSNSVIEHVGSFEDQKRFAAEARRVGKQIFVQTPNRWFFIEPHFVAFFVHYLPRPIAKRLLPIFSVRGIFQRGDNIDLKQLAEEVRLLSYWEFQQLFFDCEIHREKWFGMTKSFIAIRR